MEQEQQDSNHLVDYIRDLWQEIKRLCADMHNDFQVFHIREQERTKQGSLSITSYAAKLKAIWR